MLDIDYNNEIHLTRGDSAILKPIPEIEKEDQPNVFEIYEFEEGDRVIFRLANNQNTILEKECWIDLENNKATLILDPEDTKSLSPKVYFYCFELITVYGGHFTFVENARFTLGKELEKHVS